MGSRRRDVKNASYPCAVCNRSDVGCVELNIFICKVPGATVMCVRCCLWSCHAYVTVTYSLFIDSNSDGRQWSATAASIVNDTLIDSSTLPSQLIMKNLKKTLVSSARRRAIITPDHLLSPIQLRKTSQDSNSSKKESKPSTGTSNVVPPAPPPNSAKPLPTPGGSSSGNHLGHTISSQTPSQIPASSHKSSSPITSSVTIPDRRSSVDNVSPAPPIVVVSSDGPETSNRINGNNTERFNDGVAPPRATTLNRLRAGPKDTIPMVGKPPRKQRSSRFVVTEKVEIERLPPFMGACHWHLTPICY